MTRNQRFSLMSMARPFSPTLANPSGSIGILAQLQLVYCYPLRVFPPAVPPVMAVISDALVYESVLSDAAVYTVTLSDA